MIKQQNSAGGIVKHSPKLGLAFAHFVFGAARPQNGVDPFVYQYRRLDGMESSSWCSSGVEALDLIDVFDQGG